jgi:hypothetical protein
MIRALGLLALLSGVAAAEPARVLDGTTGWRVDLPDGFDVDEEPPALDEGGVLAGWHDGRGRRVAVGRLRGNTDGGREGDRAYLAAIEAGVARATTGYRKLRAARRTLAPRKLVAYDLWYRSGDAVRGARFVILRGYALVLSVHAPRTRRIDPALRRALESFRPET